MSILSGAKDFTTASPTGGEVVAATYSISPIMTKPAICVKRSIAFPASFTTKINIAITALIAAPAVGEIPVIAFNPSPAPAIFPILNASPPITMKTSEHVS